MSNRALEQWFSIDARRNRKSFIFSIISLFTTFVVFYFIWLLFAESPQIRTIGLLVFGIPTGICSYLLVAQRLRDFGVSGWFTLLQLPINAFDGDIRGSLTLAALVVLCGIPGTNGPNKFGDDPLG